MDKVRLVEAIKWKYGVVDDICGAITADTDGQQTTDKEGAETNEVETCEPIAAHQRAHDKLPVGAFNDYADCSTIARPCHEHSIAMSPFDSALSSPIR